MARSGAAVAGMAVRAMAGAAANSSHSSTTVVAEVPGSSPVPIGAQVTALPGSCGNATVGGVECYQCGPNWFNSYFGNSSVYHRVVEAPY